MLVLTRKIGESVVIGENITVTVIDVKGDTVRVGIDAPREVSVKRSEILEQIAAETAEAAAATDAASVLALLRKPEQR
ncbi:MAG TPA: carbon storage regulator CsrA [Gryllotalpicola sp.]